MSELVQRFIELIHFTLDPTGAHIKEAEEGINELLSNPEIFQILFDVFKSSEEINVKTSALIYIKNVIFKNSASLNAEISSFLKANIFEILSSPQVDAIINITIAIGEIICDLSEEKEWPEMFQFTITAEKPLYLTLRLLESFGIKYMMNLVIEAKDAVKELIKAGFESSEMNEIVAALYCFSKIGKSNDIFEGEEFDGFVDALLAIVTSQVEAKNEDFFSHVFAAFMKWKNEIFPFSKYFELVASITTNRELSFLTRSCAHSIILSYLNDNQFDAETYSHILDIEIEFLGSFIENEMWSEEKEFRAFKQVFVLIAQSMSFENMMELFYPRYEALVGDENAVAKCSGLYLISSAIYAEATPFYSNLESIISTMLEALACDTPEIVLFAIKSLTNCCAAADDILSQGIGEIFSHLMDLVDADSRLSESCFEFIKALSGIAPDDAELLAPIVEACITKIDEIQESEEASRSIDLYSDVIDTLLSASPELVKELASDIYSKSMELVQADPQLNSPMIDIIVTTLAYLGGDPEIVSTVEEFLSLLVELLDSDDMSLVSTSVSGINNIVEYLPVIYGYTESIPHLSMLYEKILPIAEAVQQIDVEFMNILHISALSALVNIGKTISICDPIKSERSEHNIHSEDNYELVCSLHVAAYKLTNEESILDSICDNLCSIDFSSDFLNDKSRGMLIEIFRIIFKKYSSPLHLTLSSLNAIGFILRAVGCQQMIEVCPDLLNKSIDSFLLYLNLKTDVDTNEADLNSCETINEFESNFVSALSGIPGEFLIPKFEEIIPTTLENLHSDNPVVVVNSVSIIFSIGKISPAIIQEQMMTDVVQIVQQVIEGDDINLALFILNIINSVSDTLYPFFAPFAPHFLAILGNRLNKEEERTSSIISLREKTLEQFVNVLEYLGEDTMPVPEHEGELSPEQQRLLSFSVPYNVIANNLPIVKEYSCLRRIIKYCNVFKYVVGLDTTELVRKLIKQFSVPIAKLKRMGISDYDFLNPFDLINNYLERFEDESGSAAFISETLGGDESLITYFLRFYQHTFQLRSCMNLVNSLEIPEGIETIDLTTEE